MTQPTLAVRRLHQVMLPATDLERSGAFYRDILGARLIARFDLSGLAFFHLGEVRDPDGNTLGLASRIQRD